MINIDRVKDKTKSVVSCEDLRLLNFRLSIFSRLSDSLTLNLYSILIKTRRVKLYLIELFKIAISCDSTANY